MVVNEGYLDISKSKCTRGNFSFPGIHQSGSLTEQRWKLLASTVHFVVFKSTV